MTRLRFAFPLTMTLLATCLSGCLGSHEVQLDCSADPAAPDGAPCEFTDPCVGPRDATSGCATRVSCVDGLTVVEDECAVPHASCDTVLYAAEGEPCTFERRCATVYSDFWMGMCGESGLECVAGRLQPYDAMYRCEAQRLPDGSACTVNESCQSGFCYGLVGADGSFGESTCQSACLTDADAESYCDEDADCCPGYGCHTDGGELHGRCYIQV